jgi:hypothetical protein
MSYKDFGLEYYFCVSRGHMYTWQYKRECAISIVNVLKDRRKVNDMLDPVCQEIYMIGDKIMFISILSDDIQFLVSIIDQMNEEYMRDYIARVID